MLGLYVPADQIYRQKKAPRASGKNNDWCKQRGCSHSGDVTERSHFKSAECRAEQIATQAFRVAIVCAPTHKKSH